MIDVKVGIPHTLGFRHLSKHRVRREFSIQTAEALQQNLQLLAICGEVYGRCATLQLVYFRARLVTVRPRNGCPERLVRATVENRDPELP
jgi:hypothetical protein